MVPGTGPLWILRYLKSSGYGTWKPDQKPYLKPVRSGSGSASCIGRLSGPPVMVPEKPDREPAPEPAKYPEPAERGSEQ
jgi:hypothetical protein